MVLIQGNCKEHFNERFEARKSRYVLIVQIESNQLMENFEVRGHLVPPKYTCQRHMTIVSVQEPESPGRLAKMHISGFHLRSFWFGVLGNLCLRQVPRWPWCCWAKATPGELLCTIAAGNDSFSCSNTSNKTACEGRFHQAYWCRVQVPPGTSLPRPPPPAGIARNTANPHLSACTGRLIPRKRTGRGPFGK